MDRPLQGCCRPCAAQERWNSGMEAAVAKAQLAEQLQTSLDSAARDLKASDSQVKELSKQLEAREKQLTELQGRCSYAERRAHAGESVAKEDREQAKATITDLQQRLQIIDAELADRSDALRAAEAAMQRVRILTAHAHLQSLRTHRACSTRACMRHVICPLHVMPFSVPCSGCEDLHLHPPCTLAERANALAMLHPSPGMDIYTMQIFIPSGNVHASSM